MVQNYFTLFDLPVEFDLSHNKLDQKYYALISKAHPDNANQHTAHSAEVINMAYKTLQDDYLRMQHILQLTDGFDSSVAVQDAEFLMQFLEYQDQVSTTDNASQLHNLQQDLSKQYQKLLEAIDADVRQGNVKDASEKFAMLKFYIRIIDQIEDKLLEQ